MPILSIFLSLLYMQLLLSPCCSARPHNLEEQKQGQVQNFFVGFFDGYSTVKAFLGHYEDETVKSNLEHMNDSEHSSFTIGAEEHEKDQTTMKVFGLGLGRTGTTSLVIALEILGYNAVHDDEQVEITDLEVAFDEEVVNIDDYYRILGLRGYNVTFKAGLEEDGGDWIRDHPEIKVILTVRDNPDKYVDSWLWAAPFVEMLETAPFCWMKTAQLLLPSFLGEYKEETTGGHPEKFLDRETLREAYVNYINAVEQGVDQEQLLIFNVKEGWEPLCHFLGHPIPAGIPFPHVNTKARLQGEMCFLYLVIWIWRALVFRILLAIFKAGAKKITAWSNKSKHPSKKADVKKD